MLKILQIRKTQDFYLYQTKNQENLTVITPNPQMADLVRAQFSSFGAEVDSVTISKFIKDELNQLQIDDILENYRGKSELTLLLGAIWKKIGREPSNTKFNKAFNLLTEFRSFSLSDQVLETVLDHYDEELKESVLWLHRFLEQLEIVDEHKSYFLLSERLRSSEVPVDYPRERNLVFYGFDFLSASQVDLFKSLALRNDVSIPIYKTVFEKSQGFDWINWFDEHNREIIDISKEFESINNIQASYYPRGYLAKALKQLKTDDLNLMLGTKDFTREYLQEIPLSGFSTKVAVDIFQDEFEQCSHGLSQLIDGKEHSTDKVREFIQQQIQTVLKQKNYRLLKCYFIILNKINEWESLSDTNNNLGQFDLDIISKSASLDLPRTNLTSLSPGLEKSIKCLKNLDEFKDTQIVMILSSNYLGLSASGSSYTENVEKYLASIGPVKRSEFELNVLRSKLKEFFSDNKVSLLIEEGFIDQEAVWSDLLAGIELIQEPFNLNFNQDHFHYQPSLVEIDLKSVSASKLQKYLDCPAKYFHQYGLKNSPMVMLSTELNVMELGQLEHKVIEKYFEKYNEFDEKAHTDIVNNFLYLWLKEKVISQHIRDEYYIEVKSYTQKIIQVIAQMKRELALEHHFEYDFSEQRDDLKYIGSIDCFLSGAGGKRKIILDFKRSNSIFTSYKSILEYDQIQLWFYLKRLLNKGLIDPTDEIAIGYIDLSNFDNSTLFVNDQDLAKDLKAQYGFKKISLFDDLITQIDDYSHLEDKTVEKMKNDKNFSPLPREEKNCQYCSIRNICSKEAYGHA